MKPVARSCQQTQFERDARTPRQQNPRGAKGCLKPLRMYHQVRTQSSEWLLNPHNHIFLATDLPTLHAFFVVQQRQPLN